VHAHFVDSSIQGRLTAERVLATADANPDTLSVFLCGPASMVSSFAKDFRRCGVPSRHIYHEYFDLR